MGEQNYIYDVMLEVEKYETIEWIVSILNLLYQESYSSMFHRNVLHRIDLCFYHSIIGSIKSTFNEHYRHTSAEFAKF